MNRRKESSMHRPTKKVPRRSKRQSVSDQPTPLDDYLQTPYSNMCSVIQLTPDLSPTVNPESITLIGTNGMPAASSHGTHSTPSFSSSELPSLDLDIFFRNAAFRPSTVIESQASHHMQTQNTMHSDPDTETDDEAVQDSHQQLLQIPKKPSPGEPSASGILGLKAECRGSFVSSTPEGKDEAAESSLSSLSKRRAWGRGDDVRLCMAIGVVGKDGWRAVAQMVGDSRTPDQCCQRWHRALNPGITRGDWTPEEDARLQQSVEGHKGRNWRDVAAMMPGRTDQQCRYRYRQLLKGIRVSQRAAHARRDYVDRVVLGRSNEEITVWHLRPPPSVAALSALAQAPDSCPPSLPMTPAHGLEGDVLQGQSAMENLLQLDTDIRLQEAPLTPADIARLVCGMQMPARVEPLAYLASDQKRTSRGTDADDTPPDAGSTLNAEAARQSPGGQIMLNKAHREPKGNERKRIRVQLVEQQASLQSPSNSAVPRNDSPRDARMSLHHILN